jgi:hypothetical protein
VRDAWKKHAAITLRGTDAMQLAQALGEWRDAFVPADAPLGHDGHDGHDGHGAPDDADG